MNPRAFTLIELLVVITIIVVLLALLTPALHKAVYQAGLVQCEGQMKAAGTGATLYAFDHKRFYMARGVLKQDATFPYNLKAAAALGGLDDRPVHAGYIDLDWLLDPLAEKVDLKLNPGEVEDPNETVYSNYVMWYGWGYLNRETMQRLGDRWVARDGKFNKDFALSWVLSDLDITNRGGGGAAHASHPDKGRLLNPAFAQSGDFNYGDDPVFQVGLNATIPITYSFWQRVGGFTRGAMDLNFAGEDGSVIRLNDVEQEYDERIAHLPVQRSSGSVNRWFNIAKP